MISRGALEAALASNRHARTIGDHLTSGGRFLIQELVGIAAGGQHQCSDLRLVQSEPEQGVVQLAKRP